MDFPDFFFTNIRRGFVGCVQNIKIIDVLEYSIVTLFKLTTSPTPRTRTVWVWRCRFINNTHWNYHIFILNENPSTYHHNLNNLG